MTKAERAARHRKLLDQATHTDQFGALYKYVNGKLFHWRYYSEGYLRPMYCWGPIVLPVSHTVFPIKE